MAATVSSDFNPCLYTGKVAHKRLHPFTHALQYRVFYMYMDLDDIPNLAARNRWFSYNRFNLFSFYDRDHGKRDGTTIRPWIERVLRQKGYDDCVGGNIRVLCFPRILGYVFNPLSLFFCFNTSGELRAILHEVKNTFGDQHGYLLPVKKGPDGIINQAHDKVFHVSPFIQMDAHYDFKLREPEEKLLVHIHQTIKENDADKDILIATLTGRREDLNNRTLLTKFFKYPLMTLKVIGAIHYEAFHIWRKGARFFKRPEPPSDDIS